MPTVHPSVEDAILLRLIRTLNTRWCRLFLCNNHRSDDWPLSDKYKYPPPPPADDVDFDPTMIRKTTSGMLHKKISNHFRIEATWVIRITSTVTPSFFLKRHQFPLHESWLTIVLCLPIKKSWICTSHVILLGNYNPYICQATFLSSPSSSCSERLTEKFHLPFDKETTGNSSPAACNITWFE